MGPTDILRFIVDHNVAKLARWLRMMGYDATVFNQPDDWEMIRTALAENRIIITKDTGVMKRRVITSGKLSALLVSTDDPEKQMQQVIETFELNDSNSFSLCLECNVPLISIKREEVKDRVPAYVYDTRTQFVECQVCHRVYWKGTHWKAMIKTLEKLQADKHEAIN